MSRLHLVLCIWLACVNGPAFIGGFIVPLPATSPNHRLHFHQANHRLHATTNRDSNSDRSTAPKKRRPSKAAAADRTWKPVSSQWRIFNVEVPLDMDPGKDTVLSHDALVVKVAKVLRLATDREKPHFKYLTVEAITVVKKSFDGRWKKSGQPKFVYTVDLDLRNDTEHCVRIRPVEGLVEPLKEEITAEATTSTALSSSSMASTNQRVIIVGAGPAGLFAAISLAEAGLRPIVIERGQPVEMRGRDIGALFNRKILNPDSNLCYGEGGAGTWSDGKLTTRIGKNSDDVRAVLETLVKHGAPSRILVDGKPHLGTDRLVVILRNLRNHLIGQGVEFRFGSTVVDFEVKNAAIAGVHLRDGTMLPADAVVMAVGHSARQLYERMVELGVHLEPKPIAVGFRVEHPQELINGIQLGEFGKFCDRGKGKVPVADYRLTHEVPVGDDATVGDDDEGKGMRAAFSFCMCPGGQIVPTSVNPDELCLNGMSFSKRQSQWANSALVVSVTPEDYTRETGDTGPLSGVEWQRQIEKKAALMGGGNLVAPVQRMTDFLAGTVGGKGSSSSALPLPPITSSYRMGVRESPCHELYPPFVTDTLRKAILAFDQRMPGFLSPEGILHGVETRTSAPVQITRYADNFECTSMAGLFPSGEGAGYAGGIVSAAVDGMKVGRSIAAESYGAYVSHTISATVGVGGDASRRSGGDVGGNGDNGNKERTTDRHSSILY